MKQTFKNPIIQCQLCFARVLLLQKLLPSCRIVSFDAVGLYLLTFRILESYLSKNFELDLTHVISHQRCYFQLSLI